MTSSTYLGTQQTVSSERQTHFRFTHFSGSQGLVALGPSQSKIMSFTTCSMGSGGTLRLRLKPDHSTEIRASISTRLNHRHDGYIQRCHLSVFCFFHILSGASLSRNTVKIPNPNPTSPLLISDHTEGYILLSIFMAQDSHLRIIMKKNDALEFHLVKLHARVCQGYGVC